MNARKDGNRMTSKAWLFTSESVADGHPDKVADRISDEILDAMLRANPRSRAAVETLVTRDLCVIAGEVSGASVDFEALARGAIRDIGYVAGPFSDRVPVLLKVHQQSAEIGEAVEREGAGDQGIMFGFACDETPELMPAPLLYANRILQEIGAERRRGHLALGPDAKSQVTLEYRDGVPRRAHAVVVSAMHPAEHGQGRIHEELMPLIERAFPGGFLDRGTRVLVNPSGSFIEGGPATDTGLTGRKIIVDTYGGAAPHGGGAFSGKDATKVDRSGAYVARYLAKNVVAAGLARRCLIQLAYAIGVAEPLSFRVDCQGTCAVPEEQIERRLRELVSLTPRAIRERLGLDRPIYARTAAYGHFGREPEPDGGFSWERLDLKDELRALRP